METYKIFKNLPPSQGETASEIINLVLGKVLRKVYAGFDENMKKKMDEVLLSGDGTAIDNFLKEYIPDFGKLFEEEAKNVEEELKTQIEKNS